MKRTTTLPFILAASIALAGNALAQLQGSSTASTPYVLPTKAGISTISILTVDNTGIIPDDSVPKAGGGSYGMSGLPDGVGAYDNGDGTFSVLINHELGNGAGVTRDHGGKGSFVSKFILDRETLAVVSGEDLIKQVYGWNSTTQQSNTVTSTVAFNRFCSADLPAETAFFNANSGLGSTARIFMHGEEGSSTGWLQATVATGADKGKSYTLGKFNLTTNGSGLTGVGAWENAVATPYAQDKTVVIGLNDGGTGIMSNALSVYIGIKQSTGSEVDKAGLTNGILRQVLVTGNPQEITNTNSRTTAITNGTRFTLSATSSTTFSRPEDGAWNPINPNEFYFVTTDRLDSLSDGLGTQIGQTRLWRLTFDDITNPEAGGKIDLLINGRTVNGEKVNMFDNMGVNETTGHVLLQEDVGGAAHNGKIWEYDPVTNSLTKIAKHDVSRFGDIGIIANSPFNNDEESSGIIDISAIMAESTLHRGNPRESWYLISDQAHYSNGITTAQAEGGQLLAIHDLAPADNVTVKLSGFVRDRRTGSYAQQVTITNPHSEPLAGPFHLVLDSLSSNAALTNSIGSTVNYAPMGSPVISFPSIGASLAPGASATVTLQFSNSNNGAITYTARVLNSITTP
ncbi:MAG: hypothetical protein V4710_01955 [Verrucomicrobiota bacterium]